MAERFRIEHFFRGMQAAELYEYWLDAVEHSGFTDSECSISPEEGTTFSLYDEYITGTIERLKEGERMDLRWRTAEFPDESPDSTVRITLKDTDDGCTMVIDHQRIPDGQAERYKEGWSEHYFEKITSYYGL